MAKIQSVEPNIADLVNKDVVLCADKKIEMTKKIVNFIHSR